MPDVRNLLRQGLGDVRPGRDALQRTLELVEKRRRHRRFAAVGTALALGLAAVLLTWVAFRPVAGPVPAAQSTSVSPTGTPSPSPTRCVQATTSGDFDGDGVPDHMQFVDVVRGHVSCQDTARVLSHLLSQEVDVQFGSGQTLKQPFAACKPCLTGGETFAATDLNGDGRDELAVDVGPGAAIDYVGFYRVDPNRIHPLYVANPGDPPYVKPGPAILGGGFDSGLQSPMACRATPDGTRELISVRAENPGGLIQGRWKVHTTTMVLQGDTLVVTSTKNSRQPFTMTSAVFENGCS